MPRIECHHSGYQHHMPTSPSEPVQTTDGEPEAAAATDTDTAADLEREPLTRPTRVEPSPELLS